MAGRRRSLTSGSSRSQLNGETLDRSAGCLLRDTVASRGLRAVHFTARPRADDTFLDLAAGWRLRIVAPVLNDPGQPSALTLVPDGPLGFKVDASANLRGYETQYYVLRGSHARVRLEFLSATLTVNGQTTVEREPLHNYLPLPASAFQMRLIYLARSTDAPHDMALVFARRADALAAVSERVARDPRACHAAAASCLWIPATAAVRAERRAAQHGVAAWEPVR